VAEIDSIVAVSITADTTNPSRAGFGTPLVLTYHTRFADSYRTYSSISEMVSDGFTSYDDAYRMVAKIFAQNPSPQEVVVGRLSSAPSYTRTVTITSATEGEYVRCTVVDPTSGGATDIEYLIGNSETTTTVATAVELLIEAVTGVDSSSAGAVITVTPTTAGRQVFIYDLENCTVQDTTADPGVGAALDALQLENDDWYWVLCSIGSQAVINALALWVSTQKKLYGATVSDTIELTGAGTIGSTLATAYSTDSRVFTILSKRPDQFAAAAWVGVMASRDPGTYAAALKSLSGVTADGLTTTQKNYLEADDINHYMSVNSVSITRNGVLSDGTYIDDRHGIDALLAAVQEAVYTVFVNSDKVPYTEAGLDIVKYNILAAMQRFEGTADVPGLLTPGTSAVIMPTIASISNADKLARRLTGVRFTAELAGAIQGATLVGSLSV